MSLRRLLRTLIFLVLGLLLVLPGLGAVGSAAAEPGATATTLAEPGDDAPGPEDDEVPTDPEGPQLPSPAEGKALLHGAVRSAVGEELLDDVLVEAFAVGSEDTEPEATALTYEGPGFEHGWFSLQVDPGSYYLVVTPPSWRRDLQGTTTDPVQVEAGATKDMGIVSLESKKGIDVQVRDAVFGDLVAGATIELTEPDADVVTATTDESGRHYFEDITQAGAYSIRVSKEGYLPSAPTTVSYAGTFLDLQVELQPDFSCTPTTVNDSLTNMGFEDGLTGWTKGVQREGIEVVGADEFTAPWEGDKMARLGSTHSSSDSDQPEGPNVLCQEFVATNASEAFSFNVFTYDYTGFDELHFDLSVVDPDSGDVLAAYTQGAWASGTALKTTGWRTATLDTSQHIGETLRLVVRSGGTSDELYGFWTYLDSAEETAPPVNVDVEAESETGSVNQDPVTGQYTVAFPWSQPSDLTLTFPATCEDETTEPTVRVIFDGTTYDAAALPNGLYTVTIPAAAIASSGGGTMSTQVDCAGETSIVNNLGSIVLYDPSGIISDAVTGDPVVGAEVFLYKVPGWLPNKGGPAAPDTCETNESKAPGAPWSQPAPVALGVQVSPASPEISPNVNPFVTNAIGYYGWDVAEGCWFVKVVADGYEELVSPVVGVPSEVTDLDLTLAPKKAPNPGGGGGGSNALVATSNPAITGTPKVGRTLTASPGTWNGTDLTYAYAWSRGGAPIPGATGSSYVPTADDVDKALTVTVTASKPGLTDGKATSAAVTVAKGDAPTATTAPAITGDARPGGTLTVSNGAWSEQGVTFAHQWLVDGTPVSGATGTSYQVRPGDVGKAVTVVVTATKAGYADGSATTAPVTVSEGGQPPVTKTGSSTTATLVKDVVRAGKRAKLQVEVALDNGRAALGRLVVRVDGERVAEARLAARADGRTTITLPKLGVGEHAVRVRYLGNARTKASSSEKLTLVVQVKRSSKPLPLLV